MLIAIPSKGRAGLTTSNKILPDAYFYVPTSELHQYQKIIKNAIGVPKEIQGITATRNWILKNTDEKLVVFIDDDVKTAGYIRMETRNAKHIYLNDQSIWLSEFKKFFEICEQLNYKIWGIKTDSAPRGYYPFKPMLFYTYITASCMGIVNDGEFYFDETFKVKEDYEICLRHIKNKGGLLGIRYLYWENNHWQKEGGCKDYRTVEIERDAIKRLIKMYPGMIRTAKLKNSIFTIQLT